MPRLPRVSGKQVIQALKRAGFEVFDQSGSHVYLHRWCGEQWAERITGPVHAGKILKLKTLGNILKQANLTVEEFTQYL